MPKTAGCGQAAGGHLDPGRGARDGPDQPLPQDRDDPLLANHQAGAGDAARGLRCQGRHLPGITGSERRRGRSAGKQQEPGHHLPSGHGYRKERGIAGHDPGDPSAVAVARPFQHPLVRFAEDDRLAAANAAKAWRAAVEGQHFPSRKRRIGHRWPVRAYPLPSLRTMTCSPTAWPSGSPPTSRPSMANTATASANRGTAASRTSPAISLRVRPEAGQETAVLGARPPGSPPLPSVVTRGYSGISPFQRLKVHH